MNIIAFILIISYAFSYSELLEQFAAVSYGSKVFGQVIIVPLQQRHSSDFRKLLWSEQAAVLRVLSVPLDQVNAFELILLSV